jgi:two-component system, chemotaxis family, sensor kinase Cph1
MDDTRVTPADACAREPIHHPGAIQPHGALVCVSETDRRILHLSANAGAVLGMKLQTGQPLPIDTADVGGTALHRPNATIQLTSHRTHQGMLLEFEPLPRDDERRQDREYDTLRHFMEQIEADTDLRAVGHVVAQQIRALTGFNRTLIYRFDADWNGMVIAEDGDGALPSYLDLRFPASDIPAQARALYQRNRLRLIPDADYRPVPIDPPVSPIDGEPLNLSPVSLRSVSPIHLQYMRNMRTQASMSISLVVDGRLWGLISCHHQTARWVSPRIRSACDFIGQLVAQQIAARERTSEAARRIALKRVETGLLVTLARADTFQAGLADQAEAWLTLTDATGAAVVFGGEVHVAGVTPTPDHIEDIASWLQAVPNRPVFATHCLEAAWPAADAFAAEASGLLAVSISQLHASYIMWFRQELVHTVTWAGDPHKPDGPATLSPRTSFEQWKEQVHHKAAPWRSAEIDAATDFRNAIIDFVLRRAEERAEMTEKLQLSNKELEAFSYSVSHDLRAPFRHIVGYAELLRDRETRLDPTSRRFLDTIRDAALSAGRLVDDLLAFSQLNRASLTIGPVDMDKLFAEARLAALHGVRDRQIEWRIAPLPEAWGDATMLRQAVLNLLSNAVKYTGRRAVAEITVEATENDTEAVYIIRDNGIGFDMRYVGKLFGVFQRLHRSEDFEGTGIGLALTKRVIDRHRGWITADSVEDQGATFTFALPRRSTDHRIPENPLA